MAILDGLEILLTDSTTQHSLTEFDTEETAQWTTVRSVSKCVIVCDGQFFKIKIRALADFDWYEGDCLRVILDFDGGEIVNRYELYILKHCPSTRQLISIEPVLRRALSSSWHEASIDYLHIRSDLPDPYCQKGRFVFRNLREDDEQPGRRKTISRLVKEQGRIRLEVTRLQAEELVEAQDILLLQPSKVARTHKELLEKKGITIETRVELGDYEDLPKRRFTTRSIEGHGKKQMNFVFLYRKEGILQEYIPSDSDTERVHAGPALLSNSATPRSARGTSQPTTTSAEEEDQNTIVVEERSSRNTSINPRSRSPKDEHDPTFDYHHERVSTEARYSEGRPVYALGNSDTRREHARTNDRDSEANTTSFLEPRTAERSGGTRRQQELLSNMRNREGLIEAESHSIERDQQVHEQLIASLKETEVEYNRIRQMYISRIEALQESIEKEQHLLEVTRRELQAVVASREQHLQRLTDNNARVRQQQQELEESFEGGSSKRRRID